MTTVLTDISFRSLFQTTIPSGPSSSLWVKAFAKIKSSLISLNKNSKARFVNYFIGGKIQQRGRAEASIC